MPCTIALVVRRRGATVTGPTGEQNHAWLKDRGVIPVEYGQDAADGSGNQASGGNVDRSSTRSATATGNWPWS
ncbi:hypothetical protein ACFWA5_30890 [Streptomyces mirabilis]|uniref:hypothetical protein n=1 Tax=Streptomyces mirabilis TaxID=68239 RepID=UPI0036502685